MGNITEKLLYLAETKELIKEAIIEKGVDMDEDVTFREYAEYINEIEGGEIQLQAKTAMPTGKTFIVSPDSDYDGLSSVTVVGDANLKAENIAKDVTIYGVTGIHEGDNKVSEVNIYEESGGFAIVFEGGSAVTGSATFDENGLPIGLVADNGSTVNFTAGYPTSVTYSDGKDIPIIWD